MKKKKLILWLSTALVFLFCVALGVVLCVVFEQNNKQPTTPEAAEHLTGSGTQSDPYVIHTVTGYKTLYKEKHLTYDLVYVKLNTDLLYTAVSKTELIGYEVTDDTPSSVCFGGGMYFDGNYKEFRYSTSVSIEGYDVPAIGLIPRVDGPLTVKNLKTRGTHTITGDNGLVHVGGLIGMASGIDMAGRGNPSVTIENCYVATDITSSSSSVSCVGGLVGYACSSTGAFTGSITVEDTVYCGTISGQCKDSGKVTADLDAGAQYNTTITTSNSYFSGSIVGQSSDLELGIGFSSAYPNGGTFVDGDWSLDAYSSYYYETNPTLSWLQNRNIVGRNPYVVSYKAVTTTGKTLTSGTNGYLIGTTKDKDWSYSSGYIRLYNFGVLDKTINISSYINGYTLQSATSTYSWQNKTIDIVITLIAPKVNIYFNLTSNIKAYYSVDGGAFQQITSYYPQTVTDDAKFNITYTNYDKTKSFFACQFSFTNYDGQAVVVKYEISDTKYYITGFEYKIKDGGSFIAGSINTQEFSFGVMREFRVGTALKSYDVKVN